MHEDDRTVVVWFYRSNRHNDYVQDVRIVAGRFHTATFLAVDLDVRELGQYFRVRARTPKFKVYIRDLLNRERKVQRKKRRIKALIRDLDGVCRVDRKITDLDAADDRCQQVSSVRVRQMHYHVVSEEEDSEETEDLGIADLFLSGDDQDSDDGQYINIVM